MNKKVVKIPSINCNHCVNTIKSELLELDGIIAVNIDLPEKQVEIKWDNRQDWKSIKSLLEEINYPPVE